jgi:hypothetical protein
MTPVKSKSKVTRGTIDTGGMVLGGNPAATAGELPGTAAGSAAVRIAATAVSKEKLNCQL